jgi:sodium transport system permease protein
MRFKSVATIYRKEMLDTLRDRRTLISMIVLPLLAIPLLYGVIGKFMSSSQKKAGEESSVIQVSGAGRFPGLAGALTAAGFKIVTRPDMKAAVTNGDIAAAVEVSEAAGKREVKIYSDLTRQASEMAASKVRTLLDAYKENGYRSRLRALNMPDDVVDPFTISHLNLAPERKMAGFFWGMIVGYAVVLLMFSTSMYPAIEMTAGEKERRTLEALLAAPVRRTEAIMGKILAATTACITTAALTLLSLVVSVRYTGFGKSSAELRQMTSQVPLDASNLGLLFLVLLPTAVMAASLMIAIALFAKSYKEAQSYLTPLILAVVFPLIVGMLPGIHLTPALALVPLFNVCQLLKEILIGEFHALPFAITMASNVVYAALAFAAAVRIFKDDKVLFRT